MNKQAGARYIIRRGRQCHAPLLSPLSSSPASLVTAGAVSDHERGKNELRPSSQRSASAKRASNDRSVHLYIPGGQTKWDSLSLFPLPRLIASGARAFPSSVNPIRAANWQQAAFFFSHSSASGPRRAFPLGRDEIHFFFPIPSLSGAPDPLSVPLRSAVRREMGTLT